MHESRRILKHAVRNLSLAAALAAPALASPAIGTFTTSVVMPVRVTAPAADDRVFVVEQDGLIKVFNRDGTSRGVFLDLTHLTNGIGERGLLGLAFAPDYAVSGRFYVNYTDLAGDTRVARYRVGADLDRADPSSAQILLAVDQPYANHNGGHLAFGPDGMLYIGLGDGGDGGDPQNRAQNDQSLLGKMLRIDVSGSAAYSIPPDNPFITSAPRDEIWAKGLRNPWTYAFDALTGELWVADVGQQEIEEIDVQPADSPGGENYGWRLMEGTQCYNPPANCNDGSLELPLYEYTHGGNPFRCSVSGGAVYRGAQVRELFGHYLFADYCSGQIWSLSRASASIVVTDRTAQLRPAGGYQGIVSIGEDGLGELYVVDQGANTIYRIVDTGTAVVELPPVPTLEQNVPNPFNPRTEISYTTLGDGVHVRLEVYDLVGRHVRTLVDETLPAGRYTAVWDGADDAGRPAPAGVYVCRLKQGDTVVARKMALLE